MRTYSLKLFIIRDFFLILNPYNFVPLTAHIKLGICYSNELDHRCSQGLSLIELNDIFTIQEINLDKKDLSFDNRLKEIESYWNKECAEHPSNKNCKIFVIKTQTFRYSYA